VIPDQFRLSRRIEGQRKAEPVAFGTVVVQFPLHPHFGKLQMER
jgi:hypothetical protein